MRSSRVLIVLVATAGLTFADVAAGLPVAGFPVKWGPGGGTVNGLAPATYQANKGNLSTWMLGTLSPPPSVLANALGTVQGRRLIADTIQCALPAGATLLSPGGAFDSPGLMVSNGWPSATSPTPAALLAQLLDVHTCLVTRLNYFGDPILIFLAGPDVTTQPTSSGPGSPLPLNEANTYPYEEAVWVTSFDPTGVVDLDVWPLGDLDDSCGVAPGLIEAQIKHRVCGDSSVCGVTVHPASTLASSCGSEADGWTCATQSGPRPAIATRLGPCAWEKLYAEPLRGAMCMPPSGFPSAKALASMCTDLLEDP